MLQKMLFILFLILTNAALLQTCDTTEPPPVIEPKDTISLSVKTTSHTSIVLHLQSTSNNKNSTLELIRNTANKEEILFSKLLFILDTIIVDDNKGIGLSIDAEYSYQAIIKRSSDYEILSSSDVVTAKTKYAVSQEFSWEEYAYGEWQSGFSDIWGLDENNVYMTGFIKTDSINYSLMKWNGSELEFFAMGGGIGIYGFAEDDYWTVTNSVRHYNGSNWERLDGYSKDHQDFPLDSTLYNNTPYHALWGTNSNNLYLVGATGKIIHWNGEKAHVVYGANSVNLIEIHGYDENFIITTGTSGPPSIALKYTDNQWEVVEGLNYNIQFFGCYVVSPEEYYIAGAKIFRYYNKKWEEVVGDSLGMKIDIKGDKNSGEIVAVGRVNTILHWNGVKWKNIGKNISQENNNLQSVYVTNNKIFAVGTNGVTAKLFIGTRK